MAGYVYQSAGPEFSAPHSALMRRRRLADRAAPSRAGHSDRPRGHSATRRRSQSDNPGRRGASPREEPRRRRRVGERELLYGERLSRDEQIPVDFRPSETRCLLSGGGV